MATLAFVILWGNLSSDWKIYIPLALAGVLFWGMLHFSMTRRHIDYREELALLVPTLLLWLGFFVSSFF